MESVAVLINLAYVLAAGLFIVGLKLLSHPSSARKGNGVSAIGMLVAVVVTLLDHQIIAYHWILTGFLIGGLYGAWKAKSVQMTQMPEMVSLFNGFGGAASLLLGWATINMQTLTGYENTSILILLTIVLTVMIGGITFSGSLVAWGKLSGKISTKAMIFAGLRELSILHLLALLGFSFFLFMNPAMYCGFTFSFFWR